MTWSAPIDRTRSIFVVLHTPVTRAPKVLAICMANVPTPPDAPTISTCCPDWTRPTSILGFVALEVPRAGTDPQTSDEFVRRMWAFFAALPPGEFPHHVELALLLARSSTNDQFQFGIRTFLAGLKAQQPQRKHPPR